MAFPEILAPAGSPEALTAAVRCGADAVYIGGKNFSARQSAANFSTDEMRETARLCHLHGVKLYLTVNTVLLDEELEDFTEYIKAAAEAGIDACIVQDMGAADIIHRTIPDMPLHGSTQMTIHTAEGALWTKEHGFCRVVAARELSREEIKPILETGVEVEQFVHGALCMSVSGQCYLSALIGSRSANRGRCAQACRLPFSACGNNGVCALSLKDLSLAEHMDKLMADGVHSLKIEGRMKRPEYVAAAVTALRQARNGEKPDMESLRAVFSRSGFTDGYYTGKRQGLFGVREKDDVTAAAAVLPKLRELYRKERVSAKLSLSARLFGEEPFMLKGTDDSGNSVTVYGEIPVPAKNRPSDEEQLKKQLSKLGDTIYTFGHFSAECDGVSMLPASSVNALRRELTAKLDSIRIQKNTPEYSISEYSVNHEKRNVSRSSEPKLRFRVRNEKQLDAIALRADEE
ncbi:MAG: U32 family peptidase, partial [Ruminococcus sp.]